MEHKEELFRRLMEKSNKPGNLTSDLGLQVTMVTDGVAEGVMEFTDNSINPRHLVHGGALFGVMDQMAGVAACTTGYGVVTINGTIDFLRSAVPAESLRCRATVIKPGRRVIATEAVITSEKTGKLVAKGSFNYCVMEELQVTIEEVCKD